ncbi:MULTISPECIES: phosphopantetheine-binding protein [unclassified Streptomyces]|uniref:phosphopantetheine-binding protein n=1 Tax=unclassified Streptomyces TaxID=2593676 RepID=UPI00224EE90C|nr:MULTISPECIES: phosphopantetheine-binding protein [unclassified Streptomyces]MCX4804052.1 phosphopantetheine-binding protein [Streptomyces sp. NBC_01214]WSR19471.1 phosphopantetheine-binding protein [Streptomyces sp. NBC_01207]WTA23139.1 phosphopantetheine-binding protein [Streptomyces sp. NBC_00853]
MSASPPFTLDRLVRDVADVLYTEPADVSLEEDLLDQGLDSIRLMSLVEKWRAEGARISFVDLAERPTLRQWAELLTAAP